MEKSKALSFTETDFLEKMQLTVKKESTPKPSIQSDGAYSFSIISPCGVSWSLSKGPSAPRTYMDLHGMKTKASVSGLTNPAGSSTSRGWNLPELLISWVSDSLLRRFLKIIFIYLFFSHHWVPESLFLLFSAHSFFFILVSNWWFLICWSAEALYNSSNHNVLEPDNFC